MLWCWGRRGGGPAIALELAAALARVDGIKVRLALSRQADIAGRAGGLGLPVHWTDTYRGAASAALASAGLPILIRRFAAQVRDTGVAVVHSVMTHPWSWAVAPALARTPARYVATVHDALPHPGEREPLYRWRLRRELAAASGVVTLSAHVAGEVARLYGVPESRLLAIPHGPIGARPEGPRSTPRRHPRGSRPFRLVVFGRLRAYKGLSLALDAVDRLRQDRSGIEMAVLGSGDVEPLRDRMAELGIRLDNRWLSDEELACELAAADLALLSYTEASQSGVAAAAAAAGLPVLATSVGGLAEQVEEGATGWLAGPPDAERLAAALRRILDDPEGYDRCAANLRAVGDRRLSWDEAAGRLAGFYRRLAADPSGRSAA
jgi:glycosyltransferase involved in cell wall biosynthesis